ncbi:uncharacterized protein LOC112494221 isoform X2 [Cephus cinctus]|uniref:Uncharacterized protein LOC112494221 isoform X2 n=1 Tax=Cephus cinctus TaxID=211228 RepID=A0AAJ7RG09_CEPCN|nr:uncharacterized protein LOC112494221 isoform X2 [Cephus cinctus]
MQFFSNGTLSNSFLSIDMTIENFCFAQRTTRARIHEMCMTYGNINSVSIFIRQFSNHHKPITIYEKYVKLFSRTCILILLFLDPSTPMSLKKCILRQEGSISLYICNPRELASAPMESCCYDAEMDYHYCCPVNELRHMSHTTRVTGSITAAVILLICIALFCIFSSRCPLRKVFLNRRSRGAAERMRAAEETPGD